MNEFEVEEAAQHYAKHAVLGPATATLASLVEWVNANSDGWSYWRKPSQAAAKLMALIGTKQEYQDDPTRADATPEKYKAALTPIKSFRTRYERETGYSPTFIIHAPHGKSGEVWAAEQTVAAAQRHYDQASLRERAAHELLRRANQALAIAEQQQRALVVLAELEQQRTKILHVQAEQFGDNHSEELEQSRLITLATPGTKLWVLPMYTASGYEGLGQVGTSLGLTHADRGIVVIHTAGHESSYNWLRLDPIVVVTLDEARDKWWITDGRGNLVSGGHRDCERMLVLRDEKYPDAIVQQGREFIPEEA